MLFNFYSFFAVLSRLSNQKRENSILIKIEACHFIFEEGDFSRIVAFFFTYFLPPRCLMWAEGTKTLQIAP